MALRRKCQRQEQQVVDLRKLIDEIAKLEHGAPEVPGETDWETLSVCSDVSGVRDAVGRSAAALVQPPF